MSDGFVEQRRAAEQRVRDERRGGPDRRLAERRLIFRWVPADSRTGRERRIRERRAAVSRRGLLNRRGSSGSITLPSA